MTRFWEKVVKTDGCWNWNGTKFQSGYGAIGIGGILKRAHRVSWELKNGPITNGLHVLHKCDNPGCVRPDHLFLGTQKDNMVDKTKKGRQAPGPTGSKLIPEKVIELRKLYSTGDYSYRQLAAKYSVAKETIKHAITKRTWGCL